MAGAGLARVYLTDAGMAAARRAVPLFVGVAIVSALIFGPQGMTSRDAVRALAQSWPLHLGLFAAWVLATAPAARPIFGTQTTLILRSLAPPRAFLPAVAVALALLELPWLLLHARGAGALGGLAALATAAGAHAALAGRRWLLAALVAAVVAVDLQPAWLLAVAALALAVRGPRRAARRRRRAPDRPPASHRRTAGRGARRRPPRRRSARRARRLDPPPPGDRRRRGADRADLEEPFARRASARGAGARHGSALLLIALGGAANALASAEAAAGWLLDAHGVSPLARAAARALAAAAVGLVAGALHGALAGGPASSAATAAWGAALAALLAAAIHRARGDGELAWFFAAALAVAATVAAAFLGAAALPLALAAALLVTLAS
jgi:hypothetical protein